MRSLPAASSQYALHEDYAKINLSICDSLDAVSSYSGKFSGENLTSFNC